MVLFEPFQHPEPSLHLRQQNPIRDHPTIGRRIFPSESSLLIWALDSLVLIQALDHRGHMLTPPYVSSDIRGWFYHDFSTSPQIKYTKLSSLFTLHMKQCLDLSLSLSLFFKYTQIVPASVEV